MTSNNQNENESTVEVQQVTAQETPGEPVRNSTDPVRKWTLITLAMALLLLAWYLVSDRFTPFTSQARVHALVVPIAPEVSGTVISIAVGNNQRVKAGQELFHIDPERYQLAVQKAGADLQSARQSMGASSANVTAAQAALVSALANLDRSEKDAMRLKRIKEEDPGAISERRIEQAEATLEMYVGQVDAARANIEKAKQDLGQTGEQNARILQAQSALSGAELNLARTSVRAPEDGLVTDVRVNPGNFANTGAPQMTFIAVDNIWVQADFTENNLGHIRPGNTVRIVFDALPGQVFTGTVREMGYGVALNSAPLGSLPTIDNNRDWLRDAQRFPVLVDVKISMVQGRTVLRVGSQATVVILTGDSSILNTLARLQVWLVSVLSYAY